MSISLAKHLLPGALAVATALVTLGANPATKPKKPTDADEQIAKCAAVLGRNRLAADAKDDKGLKLVQLALLLTPEDDVALLTVGLLEKEQPLDPVPTKVSEDKFLDYLMARAQELYEKQLPGNDKLAPLCLVYYRMAELFRPRDEKVILGLMRLKTKGAATGLDDLLSQPMGLDDLFAADQPAAKPEPETVTKPEPSAGAGGGDKGPLNPGKTPELRGVGCDDTRLKAIYGNFESREYITKFSEYKLFFRTPDARITAWIHFGKCRRVERTVSYYYYDRNPQVKEWLKLGDPDTVWRERSANRWESSDGLYLAIFVSSRDVLQIWEKKWYEKQGGD